ncbi:MAG: histidine--tRNA ligase [Deltaproteobacteria bacterium]|nr:histidine--tRNA ligase [Deltaproteobacteria bacterium]
MDKISRLRGFRDIWKDELEKLRKIEEVARKYLNLLGFDELKVPILEKTELFVRSIGETTDIVQKEMFTFHDPSGDSVTLRPEATAGVVRAYIEASLFATQRITKLFTIGSMFRHERPQKGRFREFNQIDVEVFGSKGPLIDAELLWLISLILDELKVKNFEIEVNTVGCWECRKKFKEVFLSYIEKKLDHLCEDCKTRARRNPLRIFDCKKDECLFLTKDSPLLFENLCEECKIHFNKFLNYLIKFEVKVKHNERLVRGLDYYTKTVFEVKSSALGAQNAFIAGGRYDGLVKEMGGPDVPGIGFAIGLERLSLIVNTGNPKENLTVFIAFVDDKAREHLFRLVKQFVKSNIRVFYDPDSKSLKSQMRYAHALNADYAIIVGEEEIKNNIVSLRNMKTGEQKSYPNDLEYLIKDISYTK